MKFHFVLLPWLAAAHSHVTNGHVIQLQRLGKVQGDVFQNPINGKYYSEYLGIPYAQAPLKELRFRSPVPATEWEGVRASKKQKYCLTTQGRSRRDDQQSEDCLYLNVWVPGEEVPNQQKPKPVLIWIPGRSDNDGLLASGYNLATEQNIVVVTIDYRRDAFGFLALDQEHIPGNQGFMDQLMALQWANINMKHFGGDPTRMAIGGHGQGAVFTSLHLTSPRSVGLFHTAVLMSGSSLTDDVIKSAGVAKHMSRDIATALECDRANALECLADVKVEKVLDVVEEKGFEPGPMADERLFPQDPESVMKKRRINARKVMIGVSPRSLKTEMWTRIETSSPGRKYEPHVLKTDKDFVMVSQALIPNRFKNKLAQIVIQHEYGRWSEADEAKRENALLKLYSDNFLTCPAILEADYNAKQGNEIYVYDFNNEQGRSEAPFFMGSSLGNPGFSEKEKELAGTMKEYLGNFLRTGNPNFKADGKKMAQSWPAYTTAARQHVAFETNARVGANLRKPFCHFWKYYLPSIVALADKEVLDSNSLNGLFGEEEEEEKPQKSDKPSGCPYKH